MYVVYCFYEFDCPALCCMFLQPSFEAYRDQNLQIKKQLDVIFRLRTDVDKARGEARDAEGKVWFM